MNKLILLALAALLGGNASASPCMPGTLQDYISLGVTGCNLGADSFSNFGMAALQNFATPISVSAVQITPGGTFQQPLLLFTLNQIASGGAFLESSFSFDVNGSQLNGVSLDEVGTANGNGTANAIVDICPGAFFLGVTPVGCPNSAGTLITTVNSAAPVLADSSPFAFSSFFDIFVDLTIDSSGGGDATFNNATVTISSAATTPVPEPSTLVFIITGIAAVVTRRRAHSRF